MPVSRTISRTISRTTLGTAGAVDAFLNFLTWQTYSIAVGNDLGHNDSDPEFNAFIDFVTFNASGLNYATPALWEIDINLGNVITKAAFNAAAAAYVP